jgi:sugar lactone lactonase YvrE
MKILIYTFLFSMLLPLSSCEKKQAIPSSPSNNIGNGNNGNSRSGDIFTIAGNGYNPAFGGYSGDGGQATAAELYAPSGVVVDASGNIYVADCENCCIRKINSAGIISTIAGVRHIGYSGDGGPAIAAEFQYPYGLALDISGNLYIADNENNCIRKINTSGIISTYAGTGTEGYSGDGGAASSAEISLPFGIAMDKLGNLYIADYGNSLIREVNTGGIISTIAGNGGNRFSGDGGPATLAEISGPQGVAVDASGNLYIADYGNDRIRMVNTSGVISTIAGNGFGVSVIGGGGYSGDGGAATNAELYNPTDVIIDGLGNIYINDGGNERIRVVNSGGIISTLAGSGYFGSYGYSGDGGPAIAAEVGYSQGIALDKANNIYITDLYVERVRIIYK